MTLHPNRNNHELLSIYRRANRTAKQIIRHMLIVETTRRNQPAAISTVEPPPMHHFRLASLSAACCVSLIPILPDSPMAIPIAIGGGVSLAILGNLLHLFLKSIKF